MPPNDVILEIQDGNLGLLPDTADVHLKIGVSSLGAPNQIITVRDTKEVTERRGTGPLAEAAASAIAEGASPVYTISPTTSTPGAAGTVTDTGPGTAVLTVTGAARDAYDVIVRVTRAAANLAAATAAYELSLDGGDTFDAERAVPVSGIIAPANTGLTLTFADGSFAVGDTYAFTTTPPTASVGDIVAALDAALSDPREWRFAHVVGAATPALAAAVNVKMQEAKTRHRYTRSLLEYRGKNAGETDAAYEAAFLADFGSFTSLEGRVAIVVGDVELTSPLTGRSNRVNFARALSGRIARRSIAEDPGRVRTGPFDGVGKLYYDGSSESLNSQRAITPRTRVGRAGAYSSRGLTLAPVGSDFKFIQYGLILDKVCRVGRERALSYLNERVRVDPITGFILEVDALGIEADIGAVLRAAIINTEEASAVEVRVKRDNPILSDQTLFITYLMTPFGYAGKIVIPVGYKNPALIPAPPAANPN
jgi:hypothetical protein